MALKSPHFTSCETHQSSFKISLDIHNFFYHMCLGHGYLQYIYAEFIVRLHAEAVRRGMLPQPNATNETMLVQIMSELNFNPERRAEPTAETAPTPSPTPSPVVPSLRPRKSKPTP